MPRLYTTSGNYAEGKDVQGYKRRKCTHRGTDNKVQQDAEEVTQAKFDKEWAAIQKEDAVTGNYAQGRKRKRTGGDGEPYDTGDITLQDFLKLNSLEKKEAGAQNTVGRCTQSSAENTVVAQKDDIASLLEIMEDTSEDLEADELCLTEDLDSLGDMSFLLDSPPNSPTHASNADCDSSEIPAREDFRDIDALFGNDDCNIDELLAFVENYPNCGT